MNKSFFLCMLLFAFSCGSSDNSSGTDSSGTSDSGNNTDDPGLISDCGAETCDADQMCLVDTCVAECEDVDQLCGDSLALCCDEGTACIAGQCEELGSECTFTEECQIDEICEPLFGACVSSDSITTCEFIPPPGVFSPNVDCQWRPPNTGPFSTYDDVVMTPSVANLTDDNLDGFTDKQDIPDMVFVSFDRQADGCCTNKGVIQIVSGACNEDGTMNTIATLGLGDPHIGNSSGIALGNLHADDVTALETPEIIATMKSGGAVAYTRASADGSQWNELWRNDLYPTINHTRAGGAQPSIADLSGDGTPEVIIGNVVLDGLTGALKWDGSQTVGTLAGIGNNAFLGPVSTVADFDQDGKQEVLAGNTLYDDLGNEKWSYTYVGDNSTCQGVLPCDGFTAAGNFDGDPEGEAVIVRRGEVFVLEHDGTEKHRVSIPIDDCSRNESGPPTVADFDGDGRAEIGTAGADFYVVVDFDCVAPNLANCDSENILWKVPNNDCSSRATGSSVFDFDGDGNAEVVYADERNFRIFSGKDGTILYDDPTHSSNTRMEMPIVVDVDNDGKSEIIVPEPNQSSVSLGGIEIIADADNNWVRTRRIWNQYSYSVTNVTEDGQIPRQPETNWTNERLNNFRQNVQPAGLFNAPDLTVDVTQLTCGQTLNLELAVGNEGALSVPAGIDLFIQVSDDLQNIIAQEVIKTTQPLGLGSPISMSHQVSLPTGTSGTLNVIVTVDSDELGNASYNECDESNNAANQTATCTLVE